MKYLAIGMDLYHITNVDYETIINGDLEHNYYELTNKIISKYKKILTIDELINP